MSETRSSAARLLLLAALLLSSAAAAAVSSSPKPEAREIAAGTYLIPGGFVPGSQPDGNSVVLVGTEGALIVDTGRHEAHTRKILELVRSLRVPVPVVVNTHWHLDHVSGNALLRRELPGLRVLASGAIEGARQGFLARSRAQLLEMIAANPEAPAAAAWKAELARIDSLPQLVPDEVVIASGERALAGRRLRVELESRAVTEGDLWLFDPATRVLVAGDLVTLPVPFLDTACPERWRAALGHLAAVDFKLLVPGHGAPMERAAFDSYRAAYGELLDCAASRQSVEACATGWQRGAATLLDGSDPAFVRQMLDYYVGKVLRGEPARLTTPCGGEGKGSGRP